MSEPNKLNFRQLAVPCEKPIFFLHKVPVSQTCARVLPSNLSFFPDFSCISSLGHPLRSCGKYSFSCLSVPFFLPRGSPFIRIATTSLLGHVIGL